MMKPDVRISARPPALRTPRLLLRRFQLDDAPAFHAAMSDPEVMRFWSTAPHVELAETRGWIARTIAATEAGHADEFVVEREGAAIGKVGLWRDDEVGFLMMRSAWGRGFAREAVQALIARAFEHGRERITAEAHPDNSRSLGLLARLGFARTGYAKRTFCIDGRWSDSVYLELPRSEVRPDATGT